MRDCFAALAMTKILRAIRHCEERVRERRGNLPAQRLLRCTRNDENITSHPSLRGASPRATWQSLACVLSLVGFALVPHVSQAQRLVLPKCATAREPALAGKCSLEDIVTTGANFANLLTEISAALFFATFVYGGARYLLAFADPKGVEAGKSAMKGAAIGMLIVLSAWTIVRYVAQSLLGIK